MELLRKILSDARLRRAARAAQEGELVRLGGVWGSSAPLAAAAIARIASAPLLHIAAHPDEADDFADDMLRSLFTAAAEAHERDGVVHPEQLLAALEDTEPAALVSGILSATDRPHANAVALDCVRVLRKRRLQKQIQALKRRIDAAKTSGDERVVSELVGEHMKLQREVLAL